MVHELSFGQPEEVAQVDFVDKVTSFSGVSAGQCEWWRIRRQHWKGSKRVTDDVLNDLELLGEVSQDWSCFLSDQFVLALGSEDGNRVGDINGMERTGCD